MPKCYGRLSEEDRDRISALRYQGKSLRRIAVELGRDASTISRELRRNSALAMGRLYLPHHAQKLAQARESTCHKRPRLRDPGLRAYIRRQIRAGWSPERIAGRWKRLGKGRVSHEAIYQWIYIHAAELARLLPRAHRKRLRRASRSSGKTAYIPSRTPLSERPLIVGARTEAGHWEADTIIGPRHQSALQILTERKTRFTKLNMMRGKLAREMRKGLTRTLSRYPRALRRSITYDNGRENVDHLIVNAALGTKSYFCQPMHSWEKGSVENAAGLIRRRLPKDTDFAMVTPAQVKRAERWINGLPRKCLGFQTAAEAFRLSVALAS
jgi:transposase, IS30 family